jgi:hypothetical protein
MSMSLILWKTPVIDDPDQAKLLVDRLLEQGDEDVLEASEDVVRFYDELTARYPPLETFSDEELEAGASPWADSPERSDRHVFLAIRWSASDDVLHAIDELARTYELVLYDPQGPNVGVPSVARDEVVRPTRGEVARTFVLAFFGVVLAAGAWILSIPILTWMLVIVGGFVTFVAIFVLVEFTRQEWRLRSEAKT